MKINLKSIIEEILSDGTQLKLIDIFNKVKEVYPTHPANLYLQVYICLKENKQLFNKVKYGVYQLHSLKDTANFLLQKKDSEEISDEIEYILNKKPYQTPSEIHKALNNKGIFISYKTVWDKLSKAPFTRELGVVNTKKYSSRYFVEK